MQEVLPSSYQPGDFEDDIYRFWLEKGYFKSKPDAHKKPYTIVIPPPNVTGMLHMGHILNNTIQDVLIRYHRMNGYEACWIPGTDHASIATEAKVVQYLADKGLKKTELGREKFLEYAREWKEKYGGIIISQLKKLGASCDWDRERFTMDDEYYKSVIHSFVELYKKGMIYKGFRLVNWCPVSRSAISDEEVYYREIDGKLYYFKYPVKGSDKFLEIATTRPETMLGDTAVAVNPKDKRYKDMVGKKVILPIVDKEIPVIADEYVDIEFGTGVVKITPAHDPNDYKIGEKYNLEFINILNEDASLNDNVPEEFRGLDRYEAREAVVEKMKELKLLSKIENYKHKVGYSERGHVPIEPYLSDQWFMKMEEITKPAIEAVKSGKIEFYPERWTKTYYHWLENVRDWCISRQLWWGHRIPVYYCDDCGYFNAYEEAPAKCEKCGSEKIRQDEDVLDTWASSWLWPFAVHHWPKVDADLKYYYPTDTLVTAPDIIFFWVARMIMAGQEFMKGIPFKKVYFTGLIRDEQGRKMSKSLGNSPDPLDVIREFGADALRYTITRLAPLGNDILYANEKCELGRNFANKIWNAARFIFHYRKDGLEKIKVPTGFDDRDALDGNDRWILSRFNKTVKKVREEIESFRFNDATVSLYDLIWSEFCDWYIEIAKIGLNQGDERTKATKMGVLMFILDGSLKMLHPYMPYLTEKIYQTLPDHEETIMRAAFPKFQKDLVFEREETSNAFFQEVIVAVRNVRGENKIQPGVDVNVKLVVEDIEMRNYLSDNEAALKKLAKVKELHFAEGHSKGDNEIGASGKGFEVFVSVEGLIDVEKEKERLKKEIQRIEAQAASVKGKLENKNFTDRAPKEVVQKEQEKLDFLYGELEKNKKNLSTLK